MMKTLTVGVDVSKNTLEVSVVAPEAKDSIDLGSFPNTTEGFKKIAKEVEKKTTQTETETINLIIEPTGGYELPFVLFANEKGWHIFTPNPYQVRQWAKGTGGRAKTDKIDARMLAQYGVCQSLPEWKPLPEHVARLEQLLKRQEELKDLLRQEQNRLHALNAKGTTAGPAIASVNRVIESLQKELDLVSGEVDQLFKDSPDFKEQLKKLKTTPGVGDRNAPFLLVVFHRWQLISTGKDDDKSLTAYTGLDPVPYQSGTSVHRHSGISRQGDSKIRSLLYMGALGGIRGDSPLTQFYQRLVNRGKAKKLALIACARKILIWAWAVFSKNTDFDPTRFSLNVSN
jgi:transposase